MNLLFILLTPNPKKNLHQTFLTIYSSMNSLWTTSCALALFYATLISSDPQIHTVSIGCGQLQIIVNGTVFFENLNRTFSDLRSKLSVNTTRFATAQYASKSDLDLYGVAQCRNYMNSADCLQCFDAAEVQIRNCSLSLASDARVVYDGCLLRYENCNLFRESTDSGNQGMCGTRPISQQTTSTVNQLLSDLVVATPRMPEFFAASIGKVGDGTNVYAIAQCINMLSPDGCRQCLHIAYSNLRPCRAVAEGRAVDIGCFLRYSNEDFFTTNQTTDITSFLSEGVSNNKAANNKAAIIGCVVGGVGLLLVLVVIVISWFRTCRRERDGDIFGATELKDMMNYKYKDLTSATNNFSKENKLGEGGFGDVYKATLKNGKIVAAKRLAIAQLRNVKSDFESEVKLLSSVHHRNLIRLLGGCNKRQELLLIYEYMANGSLDKFLFGDGSGSLSWKQRLDIIVGTARGLAYLHEQSRVCIIHRDIKASNILLDDDFQPKIADFGLARLLPDDQSHVNTRLAGTMGYMAPEYAIHGHLSPKADTYSYGVVVLEIISGRKSNDMKLEPATQYLVEWAWRLHKEDMVMDLVDKRLDPKEYDTVEVKKVIQIALLCTQSLVDSRPTMFEIVVRLS